MVFFNYSTMQMAAKVVYYGPGLCGKTTNLQFIYGHTSQDSRGEMVSLETETDRTLFFDLLPIDVGSIGGFNTRIQLYTVPGQVFYNTTRKLVLKGVDGVVFVADSQRPMLQANVESLKNLQINLEEMNLTVDTMPIVLQYNKRDLPDVCSIEEMEQALNPHGWPSFGASAVTGQGVFETLKGISKLTLLNLKKRLTKPGSESSSQSRITAVPASSRGPQRQRLRPPVRRRRRRSRQRRLPHQTPYPARLRRRRSRPGRPAGRRQSRRRCARREKRAALSGRPIQVEPGRRPRRAREDSSAGDEVFGQPCAPSALASSSRSRHNRCRLVRRPLRRSAPGDRTRIPSSRCSTAKARSTARVELTLKRGEFDSRAAASC